MSRGVNKNLSVITIYFFCLSSILSDAYADWKKEVRDQSKLIFCLSKTKIKYVFVTQPQKPKRLQYPNSSNAIKTTVNWRVAFFLMVPVENH